MLETELVPCTDPDRAREVFLRDERYISLRLAPDRPAFALAGRRIAQLDLPDQCLVAAVRRDGRTLVPQGNTKLEANDRMLVIGEPEAISVLYARYLPEGGDSKSIA